MVQPPTTTMQFEQDDRADGPADRQMPQEALLELGEIDVEHHHDEEEQDRHRADIDDDEDHRQKFRAEQEEQPRRVEEGEDQEQHRMHGIARRDHHEGGADEHGGEEIEEQRRDAHRQTPSMAKARGSTGQRLARPDHCGQGGAHR